MFDESLLKVQRANRHIHEVDILMREYFKTDFCEVRVQRDTKTEAQEIIVEVTRPPPADIPLAIGDAIHNLRSALDYLSTQAIRPTGRKARLSFPLHEKRDTLEASFQTSATGKKGSHAIIKEAIPELVPFILNEIKPYRAGNKYLWAAAKLDNMDKHNLIIPTVNLSSITNFSATNHKDASYFLCTMTVMGDGPFTGFRHGSPHPIEITNKGCPIGNILFPDGAIFGGQPIGPTLVEMSHAVSTTVNAFTEFFSTRKV